jgi:hypothetical protein
MNWILSVVAIVGGLMVLSVHDLSEATKAKAAAQSACRAPIAEGDITLITIDVRAGTLYVDCHYATTRPSKPRKGA